MRAVTPHAGPAWGKMGNDDRGLKNPENPYGWHMGGKNSSLPSRVQLLLEQKSDTRKNVRRAQPADLQNDTESCGARSIIGSRSAVVRGFASIADYSCASILRRPANGGIAGCRQPFQRALLPSVSTTLRLFFPARNTIQRRC
jgi:hypothetical protein